MEDTHKSGDTSPEVEDDEISEWLARTGNMASNISFASASIANIYLEQVAARLHAVQERHAREDSFFESFEEMKEQVSKSNSKWMQLFQAKDYAGISQLYTADCKIMVSGCELMVGREAATKCFEGMAKSGIHHGRLDTDELQEAGDFLIERGHYTMFNADSEEADKGKYCVVWKKVEGEWKMYWDCPNSNYVAMS